MKMRLLNSAVLLLLGLASTAASAATLKLKKRESECVCRSRIVQDEGATDHYFPTEW